MYGKSIRTAKKVTVLGFMTTLAIVFSMAESLLSSWMPFPGMRLGLSNIVIMFVFFRLGRKSGFLVAFMKSVFVFFGRGSVAFFLSLGGGAVSLLVIALLIALFKDRVSVLLCSVIGAIFHNLAQLTIVYLIYGMNLFLYFTPMFVIFGVLAGCVTAYLLKLTAPYLRKLL